MSALIDAIERNDLKRAKYLIEKRAGIHNRDKNGKTALMYARIRNQYEIVRILIERGAEISSEDKRWFDKETQRRLNEELRSAAQRGDVSEIRRLCAAGAENVPDQFGVLCILKDTEDNWPQPEIIPVMEGMLPCNKPSIGRDGPV